MCRRLINYNFLHLLFFFFKQKTAYEMRISDWSSDVCSSDLRKASVSKLATPSLSPTANSNGQFASAPEVSDMLPELCTVGRTGRSCSSSCNEASPSRASNPVKCPSKDRQSLV